MSNLDTVYGQALSGSVNNPGLPIALAQLVTAQSQHESANYTSDVFNNSNNVFGYGYDASSQYQTGSYNGYGTYGSINDSVQEIVDYIYRRQADGQFPDLQTITTATQYATYLKDVTSPGPYFAAPLSQYISGITSYLGQDNFSSVASAAAATPSGSSSAAAVVTEAGISGGGVLILIAIGVGLWYLFRKK